MKKQKGNFLRKIMAGLLSTVLIAGMVSGAIPMKVYAEKNAETENVAGSNPLDETESETTDITGELPEGTAGETEKDPAEEPSEETTTDPAEETTEEEDRSGDAVEDAEEDDALTEDETAFVEEETALMEENPENDVVLFAEHIHNDIIYEPWTETDSLPEAEGNYYLTQNVTITERWLVKEGTIKLCLNGKTITMGNHTFGKSVVIISANGGELDLYDCVGSGKMTGADDSCVSNFGIFRMYGGEISGNSNDEGLFPDLSGGGVSNNQGTFYMYGGRITNNHNKYGGGGVYNKSDATFYMYGGEITNNVGGGVRNVGTFYLYDGKIESNTTSRYGGGGVKNEKFFYMYGGRITNNTSLIDAGGGVSNASLSGAFYMYGGEISGNASLLGGGGVMIYSPIYVYGGKISGNRVVNSGSGSGGVWFGSMYSDTGVSAYGQLTVGGSAVISGNKDISGTESNVGVSSANAIVIDGEKALSGNAVIGITVYDGYRPTEENPRRVTAANAADYSSYFYSDNPDYVVQKGADNAIFIAVGSSHVHQWADTWDCNATHHWHDCTAIGCPITNNAAKDGYAAHTENSGTVTKEPTETEVGIRTYKCSICGYVVRTETISATGTGIDKPDNGGGGGNPDDNNKTGDNPTENNNDGGNNSVSDNHTIANNDSESVDVSEDVIDADTVNSGDPVLDTDTETPVMIPEQSKDSEPKTARCSGT